MTTFRLDRFLTSFFFYPLIKMTTSVDHNKIPILMYHSISDLKFDGVHPYYETGTSPQVFAEHMKFLYENSYKVINLRDLRGFFDRGMEASNNKLVVLTFDDGYYDFYSNAIPILKKYEYSATIFLPTALIENSGANYRDKKYLCWEEVRGLNSEGIIVGSHTVNHPKLYYMRKDNIEFEIKNSKEKIENEISAKVESFSYPFALPENDKIFLRNIRSLLLKSGYKNGVSTIIGTTAFGEQSYFLKRIPVNSFDDLNFFKAKLSGGYNWLQAFQYIFKKLKSNLQKKRF